MSHVNGAGNHGRALGLMKHEHAGSGKHEVAGGKHAEHNPLDLAMAAFDKAMEGLKASLHKDSYNGQPPPDGVSAKSSLTPVNLSADSYHAAGGASAPTTNVAAPPPAPTAETAPTSGATLGITRDNPLLAAKGGGGALGGVIGSYLDTKGGGGGLGGVIGS